MTSRVLPLNRRRLLLAASSLWVYTIPAVRAQGDAASTEHVLVTGQAGGTAHQQPGGGLIHPQQGVQATSTVTRDFIEKMAPTANAFQLIALAPGANVATSDPFGFSPSNNITIRGLNNDSIGYTLEGAPLNDIAYYTGYPSQFADSENLRDVALSQGAAALDSPVLNAAGGLLAVNLIEPDEKPGGFVDVAGGSFDTVRAFLRLQSGTIGHSGIRAFASYSHGSTNNWRGPGRDTRQHSDVKFARAWENGSHAALAISWNSAIDSYYPQVTQTAWKADGLGAANQLAARYDLNDAAGGTDYWRLWRQPERTLYAALPVHWVLPAHLTLDVTPYAQFAYGNAPGGSTLPESGLFSGTQSVPDVLDLPSSADGTAVVRANYAQRSFRSGFNASLHRQFGPHDVYVGYWYDYSDDHEWQDFTSVQSNGYAADIWDDTRQANIRLGNGQALLAGDDHTISQTNALYAGDHATFLRDRLVIDAGVKVVMLSRRATNAVPGPQYRTGASYVEPLPRLGARFAVSKTDQVFANVATNFRGPDATAFFNTYDPTSGSIEVAAAPNIRPEYSISEELGFRHDGPLLVGQVTLFNMNFTNRQIATQVSLNGAFIQSTLNAGGQTSRGVDVELGTRPWHHLSPYVSGEYLHATIDNDIASNGDLLPTRGKIAVRSPSLQAAAGLTYDDGHAFALATIRYTGHQFATFMNDERVSDHTTGDLTLGYRLGDHGGLHAPTLRVNFVNITNTHYLSGIQTPTLNAQTTNGRYGTSIAGSAPGYYVGSKFAALVTASTGF